MAGFCRAMREKNQSSKDDLLDYLNCLLAIPITSHGRLQKPIMLWSCVEKGAIRDYTQIDLMDRVRGQRQVRKIYSNYDRNASSMIFSAVTRDHACIQLLMKQKGSHIIMSFHFALSKMEKKFSTS